MQTLRLSEIKHIKLDLFIVEMLWQIKTDTKVEPLIVSPRICIDSHVQVVLPRLNLDYLV